MIGTFINHTAVLFAVLGFAGAASAQEGGQGGLSEQTIRVRRMRDEVIQPGKELWIYESTSERDRPREVRLCGTRALQEAKKFLADSRSSGVAFDCEPYGTETPMLLCKASGNLERSMDGAGFMVDPDSGRLTLRMYYRYDSDNISFAEQRRQNSFLVRTQQAGCRGAGPYSVWHPPYRPKFIESLENRLERGDERLIGEVSIAPSEFRWGFGCHSCGRGAPGCAECRLDAGMNCMAARHILIAPDEEGALKIRDDMLSDPDPLPFGGIDWWIEQKIQLLGLKPDPEPRPAKPFLPQPSPNDRRRPSTWKCGSLPCDPSSPP